MEVVTELGVTAEQLRAAAALEAPDAPVVGPTRPVAFATEARATLQLAVEQALRLGHNYVGTEHLLLAILAAPDTAGARLLTGLGVTRRKASTRVKQSLARIVAQRTDRATT
jgi:ATP-dependent Clp protease ATP-binding subunit ClpA